MQRVEQEKKIREIEQKEFVKMYLKLLKNEFIHEYNNLLEEKKKRKLRVNKK